MCLFDLEPLMLLKILKQHLKTNMGNRYEKHLLDYIITTFFNRTLLQGHNGLIYCIVLCYCLDIKIFIFKCFAVFAMVEIITYSTHFLNDISVKIL